MPTHYLPAQRTVFSVDHDTGFLLAYKDTESVINYTLDWSRVLGSETISTSTWSASGVSVSNSSSTTTTTSTRVSNSGGEAKNTITTSGGQTLVRTISFRAVDQ